jgi:hypothetical protein
MNKQDITLGGDRMRVTNNGDGNDMITYDDVGIGRSCGDCTLCCRLLPIADLKKPAGVKCQHVRYGKGCSIYPSRPLDCRAWACRWVADPEVKAAGLPRPDRAHYVLDVMWDYVEMEDKLSGERKKLSVLQVWVDPQHPDAWRSPALREYLLKLSKKGSAAIIRWSSTKMMVLFPPTMSADGEWHEVWDGTIRGRTPEEDAILDRFQEVTP